MLVKIYLMVFHFLAPYSPNETWKKPAPHSYN